MKCVACKEECTSYICLVCRIDAKEVVDSRGRVLAVILANGNMHKILIEASCLSYEKCAACKGAIEIGRSNLCKKCEEMVEKYGE